MKLTKEDNYNYWSKVKDLDPYIDNPDNAERTKYVMEKISKAAKSKDASILEIGCNVGRNLNALHTNGFTQLIGVDINEEAIDVLTQLYPELYVDSVIECKDAIEYLRDHIDKGIDVIFTSAALMHIHPDDDILFDHIQRVANKAIITFEYEGITEWKSNRTWARDYEKVFACNGWKQAKSEVMNIDKHTDNFVFRLFRRNN